MDKLLSPEAIQVMRNIHERGLSVLWSFQVPYPTYGNGETMTREEWTILTRELERRVLKSGAIEGLRTTYLTRTFIKGGRQWETRSILQPDGTELILDTKSEHSWDAPGQEISRHEETEVEWHRYQHWQWESDYLDREHIEADDYTEEFIGITSRYTLTPKALELITEQA